MGLLSHDEILKLHAAVVSAGLVGSRSTLLAGVDPRFVAGLPSATSPGDQILRDLDALNSAVVLQDGSVPLKLWIKNSIALAGERREASVFKRALEQSTASPAEGEALAPVPSYPDATTRALSERLSRARARKKALLDGGFNATSVDREIVETLRELREGGRLRAGDSLSNGRYLLLEPIGQGAFALVFRAHDRESGAMVAIKILHASVAGDPVRRDRFFRGARAMAGLTHEAITRVLEPHAAEDGYHYFVMELLARGDMRRAVLEGHLAVDAVLPAILRVGDALACAHARGLVHRDVKPANILFDEVGSPKLTDFDLVTAAFDSSGGTATGGLGTFLYAAPELWDQARDADARADVYGLAMTGVFALHGANLTRDVVRHPERFVDRLQCKSGVKAALKRALAWDPEDRFRDVASFCQTLRGALVVANDADLGAPERPSHSGISHLRSTDPGLPGALAVSASLYLESAYARWLASGADDVHLLDARGIDIVIEGPPLPEFAATADRVPASPLEYVLLSVAMCWGAKDYPERLRAWLGRIEERDAEAILTALTRHMNARVRLGAVGVAIALGTADALTHVLQRVGEEADENVRHAALRVAAQRGLALPVEQARLLLGASMDWVSQSYALRSLPPSRNCLLFSDDTDFAHELGAIAHRTGFRTIAARTSQFGARLRGLVDGLFEAYELVVLVRGEHFSQFGSDAFYGAVQRFVETGGKLLATAWVGWETVEQPFASVLPFEHIRDTYNEDVIINCRPTAHELASRLLGKPATLRTSVEMVHAKDDAVILLESEDGLPILGYRRFGEGICYYLNTCQHSCIGQMPSPLRTSPELHGAMVELLRWIHGPTRSA